MKAQSKPRATTSINRSLHALMGVGLELEHAQNLVAQKLYISVLRRKTAEELRSLNIPEHVVSSVKDPQRPPIPPGTVYGLLWSARSRCCVCRKKRRLIIHHIIEWSKSKSHDESNLAVLCHGCHDEAHTLHQLSRNLTPERILHAKEEWLKVVAQKDLELSTSATWQGLTHVAYDYFNIQRVFQLLKDPEMLKRLPHYGAALDSGYIDAGGNPLYAHPTERRFIFDGGFCGSNCYFHLVREAWESLLHLEPPKPAHYDFNRTFFANVLNFGKIIAVRGAFRFKSITNKDSGPGQLRNVYLRKRGVRIQFQIDAWETLSSSAHSSNLRTQWVSTGFLLVRGLTKGPATGPKSPSLIVHATCIALATGMGPVSPTSCPWT